VAANVLVIPSTRGRLSIPLEPATNDDTTVRTSLETRSNIAEEDKSASPQKRQRTDGNTADVLCSVSYWPCSPEAFQLFRPRRGGSRGVGSCRDSMACAESPKEAVELCIKQSQSVHSQPRLNIAGEM
jgi:hypothetical protein